MQLLDKLIPGFQARASASVDINGLCAPVCLPTHSLSLITDLDMIKLQSWANFDRSEDTSQLKVAIAGWLNTRGPHEKGTHFTPRVSAKWKEERGILNDTTGQLLCPIDYDWDDLEYVSQPLSSCRI